MGDITKLPKWAQEEISALKANQNKTEYGANVEGCHIENTGIKHSEETVTAICSIADAMRAHSEALQELAKSVSGSGQTNEFGAGIHLSDVRCK